MPRLKAIRVRGAEEAWESGHSGHSGTGIRSSCGRSGDSGKSGSSGSSGSKGGFGVRRAIRHGVVDRLHFAAIHLLRTGRKVDSQSRISPAWLFAGLHSPIFPLSLSPYPQSLHAFHHISTYLVLVALDIVS